MPKLAIVVSIGTKPFIGETISTVIVSEKLPAETTMSTQTKVRITLVFNDLAIATISFATASSSFAALPQFSFELVTTLVCGLELF